MWREVLANKLSRHLVIDFLRVILYLDRIYARMIENEEDEAIFDDVTEHEIGEMRKWKMRVGVKSWNYFTSRFILRVHISLKIHKGADYSTSKSQKPAEEMQIMLFLIDTSLRLCCNDEIWKKKSEKRI